MRSHRRRPPWLLAPALALALGGPASAADEAPARPPIYKWVDANGIAHYTTDPERIPAELRGLVRERREDAPLPAAGAPESATDAWAVRDAAPAPVETAPPEAAGAPGSDARRVHATADPRELDGRIAALEEEIARDEERIKAWVSDPAVDPVTLADDPGFRELAARLPRLQADLRSLREQKQGGREP
jgi:hypothetical protein